jgi:hypothetical protein
LGLAGHGPRGAGVCSGSRTANEDVEASCDIALTDVLATTGIVVGDSVVTHALTMAVFYAIVAAHPVAADHPIAGMTRRPQSSSSSLHQ